jgi:hypothetical protein
MLACLQRFQDNAIYRNNRACRARRTSEGNPEGWANLHPTYIVMARSSKQYARILNLYLQLIELSQPAGCPRLKLASQRGSSLSASIFRYRKLSPGIVHASFADSEKKPLLSAASKVKYLAPYVETEPHGISSASLMRRRRWPGAGSR